MAGRPRDRVTIEGDAGAFDAFTSIEITNDLTAPAEASFECGDDASWRTMEERIAPGTAYRVLVNGRLRLTGKVYIADVPVDAAGGATVRFVVRTKVADAAYASASPQISILNTTLKDVVLRAYGPLGFLPSDFIFKADLARDLMTGRSTRGGDRPVDLEPLDFKQAKVNPPETIFDFVERHLARFHLSHWDAPDGKIVVGAPNDMQPALYNFRLLRGAAGRQNNVTSAHRTRDMSDAPTTVSVSTVVGPEVARYTIGSTVRSRVEDVARSFYRPIILVDANLGRLDATLSRAKRELMHRSKKLEAWDLTTDGWSFWTGQALVPYAPDTVADVEVDVAGGPAGAYLVHRTILRLDPDQGFTAQLSLLRRGLWVL